MKKHGFTLMEMVVVIAIIGLILPVFFNITYSLSRQYLHLQALQKVKEEGDFAKQHMLTVIRNRAVNIDETCADIAALSGIASGNKICFLDSDLVPFGYALNSSGIASYSAALAGGLTQLINTADGSIIPVNVSSVTFTKLTSNTLRATYTVGHTPTTAFVSPVSLTYRFYIVLR